MVWEYIFVACVAAALGGLIGWLFAGRQSGAIAADRDQYLTQFKAAIADLAQAEESRESAEIRCAGLMAERDARDAAHAQQVAMLQSAREGFTAQFQDVGAKLLDQMQGRFLDNASARFKASGAGTARTALTTMGAELSASEALPDIRSRWISWRVMLRRRAASA